MLRHSGPLQFHCLSVGQCWGRPLLPAGPRSRGRQPGDCRFLPCCSSVPASAPEHQLIQGVLRFLCVTAYRAQPHTDELLRICFLAQPLYIYIYITCRVIVFFLLFFIFFICFFLYGCCSCCCTKLLTYSGCCSRGIFKVCVSWLWL